MAKQQQQVVTPYYVPSNKATAKPKPAPAKVNKQKHTWRQLRQQATGTLKGQFVVLAASCMLLTLVMALYSFQSLNRAENDLNTIASGSIPSVDAAQTMAQYMDDIDAKSADYLATAALLNQEPCSIPGSSDQLTLTVHNCDDQIISAEITLANDALYKAAHNVTYPGERIAVERITAGFEEYIADISIMRYEFQQTNGHTDPHNVHMTNAYIAYQNASYVLHQRISSQPATVETNLPSCQVGIDQHTVDANTWVNGSLEDNLDCLSSINKTALDQAYNDTTGFLNATLFIFVIFLVGLTLLLLWTIGRMMWASHRVVNLGLVLALLLGVTFSFSVASFLGNLSGRHGDFGQMVKDDYDSVYYAALLQRYGTDANADESRWLIALAFNDQASVTKWAQDWQTNTQQVDTLIQRAQDNRTWPSEDQPLGDMRTSWATYYNIDGQIRVEANNTKDAQRIYKAEQLSTGQSNMAYRTFADAVSRLSKANYDHYHTTLNMTQAAFSTDILLCALLYPLVGLLALWGIASRLRDF